jgi:hypothetical protein
MYKTVLNKFTGQLQIVFDSSLLKVKESVATYNDLPLTGNFENDVRITKDTDRMYTWSIADSSGTLDKWLDVGSSIQVDWSVIDNKPTSAVADIDDAVTKKHSQNTDTSLDFGGTHAVTAEQAKAGYTHSTVAHAPSDAVSLSTVKGDTDVADALSKRHSQNTDTGTNATSFHVDSGNSGARIKNNSGVLEVKNSADNAYASTRAEDVTISNNKALKGRNASNDGDVEILKVNASDQVELLGDLYGGGLAGEENGGVVTIFDESVTDASPDGTEHGADVKVDGNSILKVSAESDSAGSIKNKKVTISAELVGGTDKDSVIDADKLYMSDSAASNLLKKLSWQNIKSTLKTYFDSLYQATLVSGTNIKSINSESLVGSGNITTPNTTYTAGDGLTLVTTTFSNSDKGSTTTGTTSTSFQVDSGNSGARIKNNSGVLEIKNAADNAYAKVVADAVGDGTNDTKVTNLLKSVVAFMIDGGGEAIETGIAGWVRVPFDCTITSVEMVVDQTGSIKVDIWKQVYGSLPATNTETITGANEPEIAAGIKDQDTTLTDWTTSISAGDYLYFNVDSAATVEKCLVTLQVRK